MGEQNVLTLCDDFVKFREEMVNLRQYLDHLMEGGGAFESEAEEIERTAAM